MKKGRMEDPAFRFLCPCWKPEINDLLIYGNTPATIARTKAKAATTISALKERESPMASASSVGHG
jgi:hypothetical protein